MGSYKKTDEISIPLPHLKNTATFLIEITVLSLLTRHFRDSDDFDAVKGGFILSCGMMSIGKYMMSIGKYI